MSKNMFKIIIKIEFNLINLNSLEGGKISRLN